MSTYVRLVDQTRKYTRPHIIPSFHTRKKKKRYNDRCLWPPCSFLLDADGQAPSCRNGAGRQRLLPRGQLEGAEVRRRAFWLLSYSSTEQYPTAPVLLFNRSEHRPVKAEAAGSSPVSPDLGAPSDQFISPSSVKRGEKE
ncbi:hypothetical protein RND81_03G083100 [Saponaria officinalis]|uniref:Uncharacterized protein n=1 Tax=Saponaria officinalis TaxID=3572 RepID=A0AAW1M5X8_SAPOF